MAVLIRSFAPADLAAVRRLFTEYAATVGVDLAFQAFESELAALPGDYLPPSGGLLVALEGTDLLGCVAVRRFDAETAEMKRLFVAPNGRGRGLGGRLVDGIIGIARDIGYRAIRLDTLPTQQAAQRLYLLRGFAPIPPYRHNPIPGSQFLEMSLVDPPVPGRDHGA